MPSDCYTREEAIADQEEMQAAGVPMLNAQWIQPMLGIKYKVLDNENGEEFIHPAMHWSPEIQAQIDRDSELSLDLWLKKVGLRR